MSRLGDDIVAIDFHTHVQRSARTGTTGAAEDNAEAMAAYFRTEARTPTVHDLADTYRAQNMMCVAFTIDAGWKTGEEPSVTSDEIIELAAEHSDVVIPFATVDPHGGRRAAREVRRLAEKGARGVKFHPSAQEFSPDDRAVYPVYEAIAETGIIALFHSGHTGAGAGTRGGGGIRLKYGNPMLVDDVAVDFPDIPIVLAHPSFPWQDEALSVALHKPNVHIDLSGWSPKYFPANLVQYARTLLKDKMLFGTDYPVLTAERWLRDFEGLGFDEDVRRRILRDNAARLLGLAE
ncbi:amidohydrolase family protein [Microbacterium marinilacus]|uniref:4-hydroxyphenyl-beta-ketoacyl-CoA hydrolase n=1 Tax=Microbacterium marinilacus TaxID=415209 RepID=A0ABP7BKC2_9MICO|nr:amidohydrolase family protein [Microbacterium marinilacus]MBY0688383.1 amidohydrolase family protein [Microbacterium marinilacus]